MTEYITAKMALLAYGIKFGELMKLADRGLIRRRSRNCDGEEVFIFAREDVIKVADQIYGNA